MGFFNRSGNNKGKSPRHTENANTNPYFDSSAAAQTKYVAPSPTHAIQQKPLTVLEKSQHNSDNDMVIVGKDEVDSYGDVENATSSFTRHTTDGESVPNTYSSMKPSHLNSLFNGHLMKWKFEAEEGTCFIRVPAFFGALGLLVTAILAVVLYPAAWEPHSIVMTAAVVIMSIFILFLEGRFLDKNPLSARAHLRNIMARNFNMLRFVWGRGLLYITVGILNIAQTWLMTVISGGFMVGLGILAIGLGINASRKFAVLRNSLSDESFLLLIFSQYDRDGDGYVEPGEFARLLAYLGMELDDRYTLKAFNTIDVDGKRRISFDEFNHWWSVGFIERGRRSMDIVDDSS